MLEAELDAWLRHLRRRPAFSAADVDELVARVPLAALHLPVLLWSVAGLGYVGSR